MVRRETKTVPVARKHLQDFAENHLEEYIEVMAEEYFKKIGGEVKEEEIHVEVLDLPMNNMIAIVKHKKQTIGSITLWDGTVYVGNYETEGHTDRSSGGDKDGA